MKRPFHIAAMLIAVAVASTLLFAPDAFAASIHLPTPAHVVGMSDLIHWAAPVAALRAQLQDLVTREAAKKAELKDGISADAARKIEGEHAEILAEIETVRGQIAQAERDEADEAARAAAGQTGDAASDDVVRAAVERALDEDRRRVTSLSEIARRSGLPAERLEAAIRDRTSVEAFRAAAFDHMAEQAARVPTSPVRTHVFTDEGDTRRRGLVDAIVARMQRASGARTQIPDHARQYGEMSLVEMAAEVIAYRGAVRTSAQAVQVLDRAMGNHSTSDFPGIFLDAMNRRLQARYEAAAPTYRRWAARVTAADFRDHNVIRAGDFPALQPVGQNGEIKGGTFSESKEKYAVTPYGVTFGISRTMIINDSLGAIEQILGSAGIRVADWENAQAYAALAANPTLLTDSVAMFHATHGNLPAAAAITVASVGLARAAMMKQTTLDGIKANFTPVTLLCGPDKQTEAEQLLALLTPSQQSNAVPESLRRLVPVADANVSGNAWYLFADPDVAANFVYAYLEGFEGPRLNSQEQWGVQGLSVKLEHDFGVAPADYRGGVKNAGA